MNGSQSTAESINIIVGTNTPCRRLVFNTADEFAQCVIANTESCETLCIQRRKEIRIMKRLET